MIKRLVKFVLTFVLALIFGLPLSGVAFAQPVCLECLWALVEVYSNADGSVQFLVMLDTHDVPGRLAGQTLVASNGSTENSFTFPADLPNAAGRYVLVGTQGFADLHLVEPDFIVPNGFIFVPNGTLQITPNSWYVGTVRYAALPIGGVKALYPDAYGDGFAYTETAQAINYGYQSYIFNPGETFGGLWWNAPSGSESGWGLAVDHQGDTVFAAWATYDTDGSPTWFVMPGAKHVVPGRPDDPYSYFGAPHTYLGAIYRTTGPAFNSVPFDPSAVTVTQVGNGGISFSTNADDTAVNNGDNSLFWFTTSESNIVKAITREIFASPVPVCVEGTAAGPTPNFQGMWWNRSESGWGLYLAHQGDIVVAVWFTYDTTGKATWFVMAASKTAPNTYTGAIYRTTGPAYSASTFDPSKVTEAQVGSGTLMFADRANGTFSYTVNAAAQKKSIAREIFATPPTVCN